MAKHRSGLWILTATGALVAALSLWAPAGPVSALNQFTPGSVADANAVNANFAACKTAIDDNHAQIDAVRQVLPRMVRGMLHGGSALQAGSGYAIGMVTLIGWDARFNVTYDVAFSKPPVLHVTFPRDTKYEVSPHPTLGWPGGFSLFIEGVLGGPPAVLDFSFLAIED